MKKDALQACASNEEDVFKHRAGCDKFTDVVWDTALMAPARTQTILPEYVVQHVSSQSTLIIL